MLDYCALAVLWVSNRCIADTCDGRLVDHVRMLNDHVGRSYFPTVDWPLKLAVVDACSGDDNSRPSTTLKATNDDDDERALRASKFQEFVTKLLAVSSESVDAAAPSRPFVAGGENADLAAVDGGPPVLLPAAATTLATCRNTSRELIREQIVICRVAGDRAVADGLFDAAIAHYTRGVALDPDTDHGRCLLQRAKVYARLGRHADAVNDASASLCRCVTVEAQAVRAVSHVYLGNVTEALFDLDGMAASVEDPPGGISQPHASIRSALVDYLQNAVDQIDDESPSVRVWNSFRQASEKN